MATTCPNFKNPTWQALLKATNNNKIKAYKAWVTNSKIYSEGELLPTEAVEKAALEETSQQEKLRRETIQIVLENTESFDKSELNKSIKSLFTLISGLQQKFYQPSFNNIKEYLRESESKDVINSLHTILKHINSDSEFKDFQDTLTNFVKIFYHLDDMATGLQNAIDVSNRDSEEDLADYFTILKVAEDFKNVLESEQFKFLKEENNSLGLHKIIKNVISKLEEVGKKIVENQTEILAGLLLDQGKVVNQEAYDAVNKDLKRLEEAQKKAKENKDFKRVDTLQKDIVALRERRKKFYNYRTPEEREAVLQRIKEQFQGMGEDSQVYLSNLLALTENNNLIVAGTTDKTLRAINKAKNWINHFKNAYFDPTYNDLTSKLGASKFNIFEFNKQFISIQQVLGKDGVPMNIATIKNRFIGDFNVIISNLQKAVQEAKLQGDEKALKEAYYKRAKFHRDYMHQPNKSAFYERFDLWNDDIGKEAYKEREKILENIRSLRIEMEEMPSLEQNKRLKILLQQLKDLGSYYYKNGKKKAPEDLAIAERIREYNKFSYKFFEYKERKGAFQRAYNDYKQSLKDEGTPNEKVEELLKKWLINNTVQKPKDKWEIERNEAVQKIATISKEVRSNSDKEVLERYVELNKFIEDVRRTYKSFDAEIEANEIPIDVLEQIKKAEEELQILKNHMARFSGLTPAEEEELRGFEKAIEAGEQLSQEALDREKELNEKQALNSLPTSKREEFKRNIEILKSLSKSTATEDYLETLNFFVKQIDKEKEYDKSDADNLLLDESAIQQLKTIEGFKHWFDMAHYRGKVYDEESKTWREQFLRTRPYSINVPVDPKYYQTTTLEDGTIVDGIPAIQYFIRTVRPEWKNEREIGINSDNKGNWLPKSYNSKGELEAKDDRFIDKEYYKLLEDAKTSEIAKYKLDLLNHYTEATLKIQEGAAYEDRLYLTIPSNDKGSRELLLEGRLKDVAKRQLDKILPKTNLSENEKVYNPEEQFEETEDDLITTVINTASIHIPVYYKRSISNKDVSYDIAKNIMLYGQSMARKKALKEILPFVTAIQNVLTKNAPPKLVNEKDKEGNVEKSRTSTSEALANIQHIIETNFKGNIHSDDSLNTKIRFLIESALKIQAFRTLGYAYNRGAVNMVSGQIFNIMTRAGLGISPRSALISSTKFYKTILQSAAYDAKNVGKVGRRSLYGQLFDLYDPTGKNEQDLEEYSSPLWMEIGNNITDLISSPNNMAEKVLSGYMLFSILEDTEVKQGKNTIPLSEAYELDHNGIITLKKGVELSPEVYDATVSKAKRIYTWSQGNYDPETKLKIEKTIAGRVIFFMRRWLPTSLIYDLSPEVTSWHEGFREGRAFLAFKALQKTGQDLLSGHVRAAWKGERLNEKERGALQEQIILHMAWGIISILTSMMVPPEDEEAIEEYKIKFEDLNEWSGLRLTLYNFLWTLKRELIIRSPILVGYEVLNMLSNTTVLLNIFKVAFKVGGALQNEIYYGLMTPPELEEIENTDQEIKNLAQDLKDKITALEQYKLSSPKKQKELAVNSLTKAFVDALFDETLEGEILKKGKESFDEKITERLEVTDREVNTYLKHEFSKEIKKLFGIIYTPGMDIEAPEYKELIKEFYTEYKKDKEKTLEVVSYLTKVIEYNKKKESDLFVSENSEYGKMYEEVYGTRRKFNVQALKLLGIKSWQSEGLIPDLGTVKKVVKANIPGTEDFKKAQAADIIKKQVIEKWQDN